MCTCHYLCDNWGLLSMESYLVWPDTRHKSGCYWLVACESLCLAQATNTLEPLDFGIPEVLSHFPSVWASAGVLGLIPESPTDSRVFLCMTGLLFMYYIYRILRRSHHDVCTCLFPFRRDGLPYVIVFPTSSLPHDELRTSLHRHCTRFLAALSHTW